MQKEEISKLIEDKFISSSNPLVTKVTYKNGKVFHGLFYRFEDHPKLKSQYRHRFIPNNSVLAFRVELENTRIENPDHSLVLDCSEIAKLEILEPSL